MRDLDRTPRSPSLDFLNDFFGPDKRHLVAIRKIEGKDSFIKAHHFDAGDRAGQQKFITDHGNAGFDIYFSPNPIKGTPHKKASKNDVAEARHLWIDLDPRPDKPLQTERAAMLALLTTNLPQGMPRPNWVIDSGRGYWGYWRLDKPQPVGGSTNSVNSPLIEAVESYGRGIEKAFGDNFADGCHNIDRIARLPGTVNTKTGRVAHVLHEHSHDEPHAIERFPVPQGLISHTKRSSPFAVCDLSKFTGQPLMPADDRGLGLGFNDAPLALEPLLGEGGCPHLVDACRTHGERYAQPLWHLDALLSTFLEDGRGVFHYISKGHKTYDPASTDAMFDRKVNDKEGGLGWPSCAALELAGCKSCAACPHKGEINSPLNLTSPAAPPNKKNVVGQTKQNEIIYYYPGNE